MYDKSVPWMISHKDFISRHKIIRTGFEHFCEYWMIDLYSLPIIRACWYLKVSRMDLRFCNVCKVRLSEDFEDLR